MTRRAAAIARLSRSTRRQPRYCRMTTTVPVRRTVLRATDWHRTISRRKAEGVHPRRGGFADSAAIQRCFPGLQSVAAVPRDGIALRPHERLPFGAGFVEQLSEG